MNDEKFRLVLHAAADDCLSGVERMPSQRRAVFERIEGNSRTVRRKTALVPVLAILLTLAIAGATAAGLGLFGRLRAQKVDEVSYTRLAHLEDAAVAIGQAVDLGDGSHLTVDQAYCDGRKLYYSYTLVKGDVQAKLFVGDGAELPDGRGMAPVDSGDERISDTAYSAYYEVEMPQDYTVGESVEFVLTVMDGADLRCRVLVKAPVTGHAMRLTGEGTADGYDAQAELYISDVDVSGEVRIAAPEDYWPEGYKLMAGGAEYRDIEGWPEYKDGVHVVHLRFDLPETTENMKLVPLDEAYAHEAIALKGE